MKELEDFKPPAAMGLNQPQFHDNETPAERFVRAKESTLHGLDVVEPLFIEAVQAFIGEGTAPFAVHKTVGPAAESLAAPKEQNQSAMPQRVVTRKSSPILLWARFASDLGQDQEALKFCNRALDLAAADVSAMADAWLLRGVVQYSTGQIDEAVADWSRVIEIPGAPANRVALALFNCGVVWFEKGEHDKAIANYTRVIDQLPGAQVDLVARALVNRAGVWGRKGEYEKAVADCTRVIEQQPSASAEQIASALAGRGWLHYTRGRYPAFLADTQAALSVAPKLDIAAFNLGLAMLACGRDAEALSAYRQAGEQFPRQIEKVGLGDLIEAQKSWLAPEL